MKKTILILVLALFSTAFSSCEKFISNQTPIDTPTQDSISAVHNKQKQDVAEVLMTPSGHYVVATFNIRYDAPDPGTRAWTVRRPLVEDMILTYGFDIFGVQEAEDNQMADMFSDLTGFDAVGVGSAHSANVNLYSAIFYKTALFTVLSSGTFWLSPDAPTTPTGPSWDAAQRRICTWGKFRDKSTLQVFWVFNSHFDHQGSTAKANSASLVLDQMESKIGNSPAIFLGDLNSTQSSAPFATLSNSDLLDETWDLAAVKTPMSRVTANNWVLSPTGNDQIDHIFVTHHWDVAKRAVQWDNYSGVLPSDHFPVFAEVKFRKPIVDCDFDGDDKSERAFFNNGVWKIYGTSNVTNGIAGDIAVPGDYDGDGTTDKVVFRPSTGFWYNIPGSGSGISWGTTGDIPVPGDYNGDGIMEIAVYTPSTGLWKVRNNYPGSGYMYPAISWGVSTDIPVPGDYNGEGTTEMAVYRPSTGEWKIRNNYPGSGYMYPFPGIEWGLAGDIPVPADYTGDARTNITIYRPSTGEWKVMNYYPGTGSMAGWPKTYWSGTAGDIPAPGDYAGDRATDLSYYRNGTWYVSGGSNVTFGNVPSGDKLINFPYSIRKFFFP